ncbi:MAG: Re/Si-specific NAD(P)(+) transhydrogenase subunit alpha [Phycisphaerales bacterium]|jgi:NAD(P) transhydrogenase subunit alpha|nr:Re/Si-specific NAD(P)(+) transhydrogenase subunit alpha [Phycisphaerales bacterium]MDP6311405.1 Re/Si-specific NAD(P)(+) transhydrogenase subunit alpha [Phycisphaerales bacterium]MDP7086476.1 Re/Si-specific NAD(P)(+) transhydrogenase subunit alpha [Phycisphaerales bacterium]MDP7188631.1 Re/Si-specific NAD(P)(+) transhydrogenase subunit alpha [Phycisphaerales bacterium]MDP7519309.1 Re/Si-specific NAD(P)(+) transhydrogenase subunit alpha [Phycisphaerales bacterium]|tara:strand:- start:753 stop:2321 length:1569 start_codon:yes stop_codon:yes gene_type:complete
MKLGIPREVTGEERRVAVVPRSIKRLRKMGFEVLVETGAGVKAEAGDAKYMEAGASVIKRAAEVFEQSDIILKVNPPTEGEVAMLREGQILIGLIWPANQEVLIAELAARGVTTVAMDCVPRISRAQKLDVLSALANIAGYRAVIEAAHLFGRFFAGQMTAVGRVEPAKVLVIGGGVAGLAAMTTARGLGAIVRGFDTRLAVKEQVESLGAEFLVLDFEESGEGEGGYAKVMSESFLEAEMKLFAEQAIEVDIIITTAMIPGRDAPVLITSGMVETMKEGSVIVDLAAERGGNCALTVPGELIVHHGVSIVGYTDLPGRMPSLSSRLYGNALAAMLEEMGGGEAFTVDTENEIVRGALITNNGEVTWPPPKPAEPTIKADYAKDFGKRPESESVSADPLMSESKPARGQGLATAVGLVAGLLLLLIIGLWAPADFAMHFTVFVMACFVGWQVVWAVTPALHTPLMSVTNAISGIIILGGLLHLSSNAATSAIVLGLLAVFFATINIAGGFLVTRRMLAMFRR